MTKRTTDQWEALLDGTADGPWEVKHHGDDLVVSICTTVHDPKRYVGDMYGEWNARLAAVAPEAVAEVVRLLREVAAFRDQMTKSAERHKSMHDGGDDIGHLLDADYDRQIAYVLTRILEGDDHE